MTNSTRTDAEIVAGRVKWFDTTKGFGFVTSEDVPGDILLHANVLRNFGQSSVSDGSLIRLTVVETDRGYQATEIFEVEAPDIEEGETSDVPFFADHALPGGPLVPARVKWFDRAKGFGFANVFGNSEDVFIHMDVLRRSALSDLQPGEAVAIRVAEGDRGKLATQVNVWESACLPQSSSE